MHDKNNVLDAYYYKLRRFFFGFIIWSRQLAIGEKISPEGKKKANGQQLTALFTLTKKWYAALQLFDVRRALMATKSALLHSFPHMEHGTFL
ncbi:MAG TPA: hypothetical protein P5228_11710 [Bacteroidales bacterium]|nr:hypothetical protein [Bacteroidales bacterium]HRZ50354.1 hypothetical protein [Bacteroidales bacterium]